MNRFVVLIAVAAAMTAVALGALVTADGASAASRDFEGRGVLCARGAGLAKVSGDGRVDIRGHGVGTVVVTGAESIVARGEGRRIDLPGGSVKFIGSKGSIQAIGKDTTVTMRGGKIEFCAAGEGEAHLKGHGVYRVGHHVGRWTADGVTIPFSR